MRNPQCNVCYRTVGWISLIANVALSALKTFVGILAGSHALVVDALYSFKDVVTSLLIILGLKYSSRPIDREHPFGYGKIEFILSLSIGLIMVIITVAFLLYATGSLIQGEHKAPHLIALWTALFTVGVNLYLRYYTRCVAQQINSPMTAVLSYHYAADAVSSLAVAFGIVGSHYLGMPWLDTVVAVGECLHLIFLGGEIFIGAFKGLMDFAATPEQIESIKKHVHAVPGVKRIVALRTRRVGQEIWVSVDIGTDLELSVAEAKEISNQVEQRVIQKVPHIGDIGVHFQSANEDLPEFGEIKEEIIKFEQEQKLQQPELNGELKP
ncbi:magnetosome biogenesis CDF transporter MamM [Magnetococcales bacterium HHB-1]